MIDFSEIEAYYGPYAVEDLDAAIAAVQNADETPDASHTNALITSAGVANAILARFANDTVSAATDFSLERSVSYLLLVQKGQYSGLYSLFVKANDGGVLMTTIFVSASPGFSVTAGTEKVTVTPSGGSAVVSIVRLN